MRWLNQLMRRRLPCFTLCAAALIGCDPYESPQLSIDSPKRGSFFPAGVYVVVQVSGPEGELDKVSFDGDVDPTTKKVSGSFVSVSQPSSEGLSFVSAELPGDPYLVNRAWLQGSFIPSEGWYPDTLTLRVAGPALSEGRASVAGLIKSSLLNTELASFVDPIDLDLEITQAQVVIDSALIEGMDIELSVNDGVVSLSLTLTPLKVSYRIESELLTSRGVGQFDRVSLRSNLSLNPTGATLTAPEVELSPLRVQDDQLPSYLIDPFIEALQGQLQETVTEAIAEVTTAITGQLFSQLTPSLGLDLPLPISQETGLMVVQGRGDGLTLQYTTRVRALESTSAKAEVGALLVSPPVEAIDGAGASVHVGRPLLNQYAFAAWDAGNFSSLTFSRAQLEGLGLGELSFPYSQLETATVQLLLPPIAGWDQGGAYLELGGIQVDMKIGASKDSTAWTTARVPIKLTLTEGGLRVTPDERRPLSVQPIMLNRLNALAERAEVLKLFNAALPGVVQQIFGELPLITIPPMRLKGLPNAPELTLSPRPIGVNVLADQWRVDLALELE